MRKIILALALAWPGLAFAQTQAQPIEQKVELTLGKLTFQNLLLSAEVERLRDELAKQTAELARLRAASEQQK